MQYGPERRARQTLFAQRVMRKGNVMLARRYMPPIAQLAAFEAAARLGSFTRAAEELDLTQSAVSRQIAALESRLGLALFTRERQRVVLTPQGAAYAAEIGPALAQIGNATLNLAANPGGGALTVAILPAFGTRWLAPRLPRFLNAHPGVTINLTTRLGRFDFEAERIDVAIDFGRDIRADTEAAFLMHETVLPCASPAFLAEAAPRAPADLLDLPLLHVASRPRGWARWLAGQGVDAPLPRGVVFDQFATMAQAAIHGLGLALLPDFLVQDDLRDGRLVRVFDAAATSHGAYRLVWPAGRGVYPPLAAFRDWITAEIAAGA